MLVSVPTVCFVAPLPPPVHGFSEISKRMLQVLQSKHEVIVFDMSPRSNRFGFLLVWYRFCLYFMRSRPRALYLALSGGHRQWIDLFFILVARLQGVPIFVHHHSFAYLNERRLSTLVCFMLIRNCTHIVLCECMGKLISKQYAVKAERLRVLSNAAFLIPNDEQNQSDAGNSVHRSLRIGFLSNITVEKGIFEFFSVLRNAVAVGIDVRGVIAGPVSLPIRQSFEDHLKTDLNLEHVGAVYGADKMNFFKGIDVLFFPTRYANEAEPVTILESLSHGVPVIAFERGCIRDMVPVAAGVTFSYSAAFVQQTLAALRVFVENPLALADARRAALAGFELASNSSKVVLESLLSEMGSVIGAPVAK